MCLFRNLWHSERKNHSLTITKFLRNKLLQGGIWIGEALRVSMTPSFPLSYVQKCKQWWKWHIWRNFDKLRKRSRIWRFWWISVKFIKAKLAWWNWWFWRIFAIFGTACISGHTPRVMICKRWTTVVWHQIPVRLYWRTTLFEYPA